MTRLTTPIFAGFWVLSLSLTLSLPPHAAADTHTSSQENLEKLVNKMQEYVQAGNYPKALEELSWIRRDLDKLNFEATLKYFPDEFNGFKGDPATTQSALGMTTIERTYKKANQTIAVSLFGGSGSGAAGSAIGGLATLGRLAMMQQQGGQGQNMFRLDGRTAILNEQSGRVDLTITLESGGMLKFEMKRNGTATTLREAAQAFPIAELDTYRRGGQ